MTLIKPYRGSLNRRREPGLWAHYSSSLNYESFSAKVHRVQVIFLIRYCYIYHMHDKILYTIIFYSQRYFDMDFSVIHYIYIKTIQ